MRALVLSLVLAVATGCARDRGSLFVQVVSPDYDSALAVDEILVSLQMRDGAAIALPPFEVGTGTPLTRPTRVATASDLDEGSYTGSIRLRFGGVDVADPRPFHVEVLGPTVFTALVSRRCQGIVCPGGADAASIACLAGRCVPPDCSEEHPELCPMPECDATHACAMSTVACTTSECSASGVCVIAQHDDQCAPTDRCNGQLGCVARRPAAPELLHPLAGAYTTSVRAGDMHTVHFVWSAVPGAASYGVSFAHDCPGSLPDCGASAAYGQAVGAATHELTENFPTTDADRNVPVGHRMFFRISACSESVGMGECSSSQWSYVEVGRTRGDYDGDGFADAAIAERGSLSVFRGSATGVDLASIVTMAGMALDEFEMTNVDLDGDGFSELVLGAPSRDEMRAGVFRGGPTGLALVGYPNVDLADGSTGTGCCVPSALGDIDDDGHGDFALVAPLFDQQPGHEDAGQVVLLHGTAAGTAGHMTGLVYGLADGRPRDVAMVRYGTLSAFPFDVSVMREALRVGIPGGGGLIDSEPVIDGGFGNAVRMQLTSDDVMLPASAFASALVSGDFDGDGTIDLAVSAPHAMTNGVVILLRGGEGAPDVVSPGTAMGIGETLVACDLDGDGDQELVVAAPGVPGGDSGVFLLDDEGGTFAPLDGLDSVMPGGLSCGTGITCLDVNGDGRDEVLMGCPAEGASGAVHVLGSAQTISATSGARFGVRLAR